MQDVSLKEFLESEIRSLSERLDRYEKSHSDQHGQAEESRIEEKAGIKEQLEHLNNLRQVVTRAQAEFPSKEALISVENKVMERLDTVAKALEAKIESADQASGKRIDQIQTFVDNLKGRIWALGGIGVLAVILFQFLLKALWK